MRVLVHILQKNPRTARRLSLVGRALLRRLGADGEVLVDTDGEVVAEEGRGSTSVSVRTASRSKSHADGRGGVGRARPRTGISTPRFESLEGMAGELITEEHFNE